MFIHLKKIFTEKTTQEVTINTLGNYVNIAFSAIYVVIIARLFNPSDNGIYIVLFALVYLLANIFDFGTSSSIYSMLPTIIKDKNNTYSFLKVTLLYQSILAFLCMGIIVLFINPINTSILKLHVPLSYYFWALITVPLLIWQNFALNCLYATRKFLTANFLINILNIVRILLLVGMYLTGTLSLQGLIIVFGPVCPILFFVLLFIRYPHIPKNLLNASLNNPLFSMYYTASYFIATQLYYVATRMDLFVVSHFLTRPETGFYGLAQKVLFSILTTVNSITQVMSPQFAGVTEKKKVGELMKKFALYCLIPIIILVASIITPDKIYFLVFSAQYSLTPFVTKLLSGTHIFAILAQIPLLFFLYSIRKPHYVLFINALLLIGISVGSYILTPMFRLAGPPIALGISYVLVAIIAFVIFRKEYQKLR